MKASKIKSKKQLARLNARIDDYEKINSIDKPAYSKPGSMKK